MNKMEFLVDQVIMTVANVKLKYDFSDVVFLSSPVTAKDDQYDTSYFCGLCKASMGSASCVEVGDETMYFAVNIIKDF